MLGISKEDRKVSEFTRKFRPKNYAQVLRGFEKNAERKPQEVCASCGTHEQGQLLYPDVRWVCSDCVRKFCNNQGRISVIMKDNHIPMKRCTWCNKLRITHFQVSTNICQTCLRKTGRKDKFRDIKEEKRELLKSHSLLMGG